MALRTASTLVSLFALVALPLGCGSVGTFSHISLEQGVQDLNAGQYAEAEGAFTDAITQNPLDYESHTYLGILYDRKQQYANAMAHFKTSLDVQPLTVKGQADTDFRIKTLTAQADTLAKVPGGDKAIDALESAAVSSKTGEESFQIGRIYAGRGDADSAVTAYQNAAVQAPDKFYIAKTQGLYLNKLGIKPQAEIALRRAYKLNDQDAEVAAALRSLGVVPGPSLKDADQLKKPTLPTGPLPDLINRNRHPSPVDLPPATPRD